MANKNELKSQILKAVNKYAQDTAEQGVDVRAAMLSGMSLMASYLAKLDGSKEMTPAIALNAVCEVAGESGMATERLM